MKRRPERWLLLFGLLSACTPEIPEGVLACTKGEAEQCPSGFACRGDLRCYREPIEAMVDGSLSAALDAASEPATGRDLFDGAANAPPRDAGVVVAETPDAAARVTCRTPDGGIACDDRLFCNGEETCQPSAPGADQRGCLAGHGVVCGDGQLCSEARRGCTPCGDGPDDGDADGHAALACGGDDCDDTDPRVYARGSGSRGCARPPVCERETPPPARICEGF